MSQGCPARDPEGNYDLQAVIDWATKNKPSPGESSRRDPDKINWHDERAREQTLTLRLERKTLLHSLVPAEVVAEILANLGVEWQVTLDQLNTSVLRLVKPGTCNRDALRKRLRLAADQGLKSLSSTVEEWQRFVMGSGEFLGDLPSISDPKSEPTTPVGSRKTSTSRARSPRTQATTDGTVSNTGKASSKSRKASKPKS